MRFSIVTNAFNQGRFLGAAMESVLSQEGVEVEYLVVEPGSSDDTNQVLERAAARYPGRFTVLRERDTGPADGLNRAFERATGDWFGYLNADDAYLPGAFAAAAAAISRERASGAVIGNGYLVNESGRYLRRAISTSFTALRFVNGTAFALQQSTFYRASAFRSVGAFNVDNRTSWDAELLIDLDRAGYSLANALGYWSLFRMQANSITVSQRYSDDSAATHARYFREEKGRDRTASDLRRRRLRQAVARLAAPRLTGARLIDAIRPRDHVFAAAQPPDWAK